MSTASRFFKKDSEFTEVSAFRETVVCELSRVSNLLYTSFLIYKMREEHSPPCRVIRMLWLNKKYLIALQLLKWLWDGCGDWTNGKDAKPTQDTSSVSWKTQRVRRKVTMCCFLQLHWGITDGWNISVKPPTTVGLASISMPPRNFFFNRSLPPLSLSGSHWFAFCQ